MLIPKYYKYKKIPKPLVGRSKKEVKSVVLSNGVCGLKSVEAGRITAKELDSVKKLIKKRFKKISKLYLIGYPDKFSTSKPLEVRMGKGKGAINDWLMLVKEGALVFELSCIGVRQAEMVRVLEEASLRISLKTKVVVFKA